jgi:hypothetical protein
MSSITVSENRNHLLKEGKPFFYLADTVWQAFANVPLENWRPYLDFRRQQGFNALQISILPITHDNSVSERNMSPFEEGARSAWDFRAYNEAYFQKAEDMLREAVARDFTPVLGVLWCCHVPGTRCSDGSPVASAMPFEAVRPYVEYAGNRFAKYDPLFFISGDTSWDSPNEERYYMSALEGIRQTCPDALLTMHTTPSGIIPPHFAEAVDFYMYQSGHHHGHQDGAYLLAKRYAGMPIKRPVVNGEPCYEGHGRVGTRTRFTARDVRRALWQSLLSGASMGFTYGAHGIWSGHRRGDRFLAAGRTFEPFEWSDAMRLAGAWDAGFARSLWEFLDLFDLAPVDLVVGGDPTTPAATNPKRSRISVYLPEAFDLSLRCDLSDYRCRFIDLETRRFLMPVVESGDVSLIRMPPVNTDALLIAVR